MTASIALELDHEGVRLLRRGGRTELGALRLDDPDFDSRIVALRNGVCGDRTDVEVVLPSSLVLFLEVGDAAESEVAARVAEESPCAIEDLVIGRDGSMAAAVERTTLEEARDFVRMHGFRAAGFAACPEDGAGDVISFRYEPLPPPTFLSQRSPSDDSAGGRPGAENEGAAAEPEETEAGVASAGRSKQAEDPPAEDAGETESPNGAPADAPPDIHAREDGDPVPAWRSTRPGADDEGSSASSPHRADRAERDAFEPSPQAPEPVYQGRFEPRAAEPVEEETFEPPPFPFRAVERDRRAPVHDADAGPLEDVPEDLGDEPETDDATLLPIAFRHAASEPYEAPDATLATRSEASAAEGTRSEWTGRNVGRPRPPTAAPPLPPASRAAPAAASPLTTARIAPARSKAEALTIFGASGAEPPRAGGFSMLHVAAAALAAGVLFAAYALFQGDVSELDVVDLDNVAGVLDPLTESTDGAVADPAPDARGDRETELAALDPTDPQTAMPGRGESQPERRDATIEAPRSELATPVALPDPVELDTPQPLSAPAPPARPEVAAPQVLTPPPPPGTVFDMDERGLVRPTEEGAVTPKGVLVHSGPPALVPPAAAVGRQESPVAPEEDPADGEDDAALVPPDEGPVATAPDIPQIRPRLRPDDVVAAPVVTALEAGEDTPRPMPRPGTIATAAAPPDTEPDFDAAAQQARTDAASAGAGIASAAPRAAAPPPPEPEGRANVAVQPSMPTRASVAERATVQNALRLNRVNLIGVYGTASDRRALIRLPTGRYIKVKVGDRVDGGRVASIQNSRVEYVKGGRSYDLSLPSG